MSKLLLSCLGMVIWTGVLYAAPGPVMCSALQTIDAASGNGFNSVPKIKPDNGGFSTQAIIPGGSNGHVDSVHGGGMMFYSTFKDSFVTMKQAVVKCLPGSRVTYDGSNDIAPEIHYLTPSNMEVVVSVTMTGIKGITFATKAATQSSAEAADETLGVARAESPVVFVQHIYKIYVGVGAIDGMSADYRAKLLTPSFLGLVRPHTDVYGYIDTGFPDPFVPAKTINVTAANVQVVSTTGKAADILVILTNDGAKVSVSIKLIKVSGVWLVDDVDHLRRMLTKH